jgi:ATP/maltotriose-dependent transcriptional regulator MalT
MRCLSTGLCVFGLLLASACTVGPNYRLPDAAMMNRPSSKGRFVATSDPSVSDLALPANWWRLYDEPALDALIARAIAENTDLRMANANLEHSRALVKVAKSLQQPSVGLSGGVEYAQLSGEQYLLGKILSSLRDATSREGCLPPELKPFVSSILADRAQQSGHPRPARGTAESLSPREQTVLHLMSRGLSNKQIAKELRIAPEIVKSNVKSIFVKLAVRTRAHAVSTAGALGLA